MSSISARITAGFYALAFLLLALSAFTFVDLQFLARHIREGSAVSSLVEYLMEARRQEKNFLLYQVQEELVAALQQSEMAERLLDDNVLLFDTLCNRRPCARLRDDLINYRSALWDLIDVPQESIAQSAGEVRQAGHRLTEIAQSLSEQERTSLSAVATQSGRWLLAVVISIGALGALVGHAVARSVARPLRRLEADLAPIAAGRFRELPAPSRDRELVSLAAAFNHMLGELEARRRQLLHSEKLASLGVLVSGVAHELNNPLSNVSTSCQLAMEEVDQADPAALRMWLTQIDAETERARQIVLALSDYARRRPLTLEPVPVRNLLEATLLLVRKELGRQVALDWETPEEMAVLADRQRLQQVFINLLKNAVDAGAKTIRIQARPLEPGAPVLMGGRYRLGEPPNPTGHRYGLLTIADDGTGIAPNHLEHIFDPFFTTRDVGQGMGLGLYIVQEIVQELDGCIGVDSEPGRGTRFEIALLCAGEN